jgi:tetratricopeptide (TPR) repeat protein
VRLTRSLLAALLAATLATPVAAFGTSGAYLAARQASYGNDYTAAAEYFTRALALDPSNTDLMESAVAANVALGDFDRALPIARRLAETDTPSQISGIVQSVMLAKAEDWDGLMGLLDEGEVVSGLVDGLSRGWVLMGKGQVEQALAAFDALIASDGLKPFGLYHKALALASVGDFEGADDIFSGRADGPLQVSRSGVVAHAQILSQLERPDDALDLIDAALGGNPAPVFVDYIARLRNGEPLPYDVAVTPRDGMAEVYFSVAGALAGETAPGYALIYTRAAEVLGDPHVDASLLSASLLEEVGQFDLASAAYDRVPQDHGSFVTAELGRANALRADDKPDAAVEVLTQLAAAQPDLLMVQVALGDLLRRLERFEEAVPAYDRAIALVGDPGPEHWVVWFSRGVSLERTDRWDEAEADFRFALDLSPGQPQVLNYLGYSLVELRSNLDEALAMIEEAAAARPNDGYITDSLGWVLYRLGRYEEAVAPMERAVELTPADPIINDHLGDVLWAVGRRLEARFQWRRALSYEPDDEEAARIRRKLDVGLDVVLEEEGAEPLASARDG